MDSKALDKALVALEKKKKELEALDYNNPKYDDLEEELHELEDKFQDEYGHYLEGVLQEVHDKICPDNDVLLPIAYLDEGVIVESDDYPGKEPKLSLVSSPPRIVLKVDKNTTKVVWGNALG